MNQEEFLQLMEKCLEDPSLFSRLESAYLPLSLRTPNLEAIWERFPALLVRTPVFNMFSLENPVLFLEISLRAHEFSWKSELQELLEKLLFRRRFLFALDCVERVVPLLSAAVLRDPHAHRNVSLGKVFYQLIAIRHSLKNPSTMPFLPNFSMIDFVSFFESYVRHEAAAGYAVGSFFMSLRAGAQDSAHAFLNKCVSFACNAQARSSAATLQAWKEEQSWQRERYSFYLQQYTEPPPKKGVLEQLREILK